MSVMNGPTTASTWWSSTSRRHARITPAASRSGGPSTSSITSSTFRSMRPLSYASSKARRRPLYQSGSRAHRAQSWRTPTL